MLGSAWPAASQAAWWGWPLVFSSNFHIKKKQRKKKLIKRKNQPALSSLLSWSLSCLGPSGRPHPAHQGQSQPCCGWAAALGGRPSGEPQQAVWPTPCWPAGWAMGSGPVPTCRARSSVHQPPMGAERGSARVGGLELQPPPQPYPVPVQSRRWLGPGLGSRLASAWLPWPHGSPPARAASRAGSDVPTILLLAKPCPAV